MFDWKNPKISSWKKVLRIVFLHNFTDINPRGITAQETAIQILAKYEKDLSPDELEFIKGLLR
jgi:hypothetical protein